jgi:hypothetical protein
MGNLLSLDVSIYQRRANTKESSGGLDVHRHFIAFDLALSVSVFDGDVFLCRYHELLLL